MHPILAAMRRNALGPALIAAQIALAFAILSNALLVINQRLAAMARPSGVDESRLFVIENQWTGKPTDIPARVQTDLAALRALPGAVDAYATNSYPFGDTMWTLPIALNPNDKPYQIMAGTYVVDSNALHVLGLQLIAGRNFNSDEVQSYAFAGFDSKVPPPQAIIITRQLARQLAPDGNVLGRLVTIGFPPASRSSVRIVGIVKSLQIASADAPPGVADMVHTLANSTFLVPYRYAAADCYYVVRAASPGQLGPAMKAATSTLYALNRARVLRNVESLSTGRRREYRSDRGQVIMLEAVSAVLLAMTGWGIVGLTTCWVNQRRRQIGIRRALGGTRLAIVRHFQTENLLIAGAGVVVGIGVGMAANLWMVSRFAMPRLDERYLIVGAAIILVLGQIAALWPALRAACVPPTVATRNI